MIYENTSESGICPVGERSVQQVAVEQDDRPCFDLNRDRVLICIWEAVCLSGSIEATILVGSLRPEDAGFVRSRNGPETPILYRGVIECDPAAR